MSEEPLVSVITPAFNAEHTISQCIESVLSQSYENFEHIVIDDRSRDATREVIRSFAGRDQRVKAIFLDENKGVALARNAGISEAKGRYIAFLDADDLWLPEKLEEQVHFMREHNLKLTYSSYYIINDEGDVTASYEAPSKLSYGKLLKSNFIGNLTGIYSIDFFGKQYLQECGHEDYVLWLKLLKQVPYTLGIEKKLAKYRITESGLSSNKFKTIRWQWDIYRSKENLGIFKSLYFMGWYAYHALTKYKKT